MTRTIFLTLFSLIIAGRMTEWDDLNVQTGDKVWFESGLGVYCSKCSYETWLDNGGEVIADEILCEDCKPPMPDEDDE